jgi:hypothetical protein
MAARDWFTDCSTLFNRHPCKILSTAGLVLCSTLLWYADRIETQTDAMQASLQQIERDVSFLRGRQNVTVPAPGGIAMAEQ